MAVTLRPAVTLATDAPRAGGSPSRDYEATGTPQARAWPTTLAPIAALILVTVAIFAGGALVLGHPLLMGDNLIQNYPLRVLVGSDLRHGHLPLWDPWIWSGTPLMAGLNAGAFYPSTLLFAVTSPNTAWVINQILVSCSVSVGTYLFMRATGTGPLASFLGAGSFAFAGAVASQSAVHIDMAEGFASLPWMLLAVREMTETRRWRCTVLLGAAVACLILAGAPEAMLDVTILTLTYGALRVSLQQSSWRRVAVRTFVGFAIGAGLSAFVSLPALHFIATSQRASVTARFASSYSFPPRALVLALVPFLEGGWSLISQPQYLGRSNLAEVGLYVGLLPVIAAIALASRRWAAWLPRGERRTWYVVGLVGLLLAMAAGTPLEHLLFHIPLYGKQRNQGRNIVDVDFASCMLLAWWLDGGTRPERVRTRAEAGAAGALVAVMVVLLAWTTISSTSLSALLGAVAPSPSQRASIDVAAGISLCLAGLAAGVVFLRSRVGRVGWLFITSAFVVFDLALFVSGTTFAASQAAPSVGAPGPLMQMVRNNLSVGGRYGVFDPDLFYPSGIIAAGEPDVGILEGLPSVEGYGAIDDGVYAQRTATHVRAYLSPGELGAGYFRPLGLQVMVAPTEEFLTPIATLPRPNETANLSPIAEGPGIDPLLPAGDYVPPEASLPAPALSEPLPTLQAGERTGWLFGTVTAPTAAVIVLSHPSDAQLVRVGLVRASGPIDWQPAQRLKIGSTEVVLRFKSLKSTGLVLKLLSGANLDSPQLTLEADGRSYVVNGPLARAMTPASWRYVGQEDNFTVFRTGYTPEQAWVQAPGTYEIAAHLKATVDILAESTDSATIAVRAPRASILVRSDAWEAGWNAEIVSGTTASRFLRASPAGKRRQLSGGSLEPVRQVGVMQGLGIPAGLSVIRFSYTAEGFSKGLAITATTLLATIASIPLAMLLARRRRRRGRVPTSLADE